VINKRVLLRNISQSLDALILWTDYDYLFQWVEFRKLDSRNLSYIIHRRDRHITEIRLNVSHYLSSVMVSKSSVKYGIYFVAKI